MNDLKEHLRAMAGMLAEERRDTAEAICLEAAAEIERMRAAMIHQQMSLADTEALCLSHEAEIERLRAERDLWKRRYERLDPKPTDERAEEQR